MDMSLLSQPFEIPPSTEQFIASLEARATALESRLKAQETLVGVIVKHFNFSPQWIENATHG